MTMPRPVAVPVKEIKRTDSTNTRNTSLIDKFTSRATKEIVIAFAGPIGCGMTELVRDFQDRLKSQGYKDVVHIKVSNLLADSIKNNRVLADSNYSSESSETFHKLRSLQEAGKELRRRTKNSAVLAEYAAKEIGVDRAARHPEAAQDINLTIEPERVAYLIDQLKRPEEVELLRAVYRNAFYLVGVTRSYERRFGAIKKSVPKPDEVHTLMEIDRSETDKYGQKVDKTLHLSDFFLGNDSVTVEDRSKKIERLLELIHGNQSIAPTRMEQGMYSAYAAGLRSACLSRQVGAAIYSRKGELLATGCNDVPKPGGGLYSANCNGPDRRCVHREEQHCFNDFHKRKLQNDIAVEVGNYLGSIRKDAPIQLTHEEQHGLMEIIYEKTRVRDLIEFSRAVHAEMDALISIARQGIGGLGEATIYTTTFPCHNCARHIIASGIESIIYIEPYEKSLARDLHDDAFMQDIMGPVENGSPTRVNISHFEGVAPRIFASVFLAGKRKDDEGKVIRRNRNEAEKTLPEYLENYQLFEAKAAANFKEELESLDKNP